jgi:hypothetical protein
MSYDEHVDGYLHLSGVLAWMENQQDWGGHPCLFLLHFDRAGHGRYSAAELPGLWERFSGGTPGQWLEHVVDAMAVPGASQRRWLESIPVKSCGVGFMWETVQDGAGADARRIRKIKAMTVGGEIIDAERVDGDPLLTVTQSAPYREYAATVAARGMDMPRVPAALRRLCALLATRTPQQLERAAELSRRCAELEALGDEEGLTRLIAEMNERP